MSRKFLIGILGYYETKKIGFIIFGAMKNLLWILQVLANSELRWNHTVCVDCGQTANMGGRTARSGWEWEGDEGAAAIEGGSEGGGAGQLKWGLFAREASPF